MNLTAQEAAAFLQSRDGYLILTHRRPDGDTIGCAVALCRALRQTGKPAFVLPNADATVLFDPYWGDTPAPRDFIPETVVSVDIASLSLFPENALPYRDQVELCIDHHPSNEGFGKRNCVESDKAACGEILYTICTHLLSPRESLPQEVALPLYLAVSTDTGCFVYANTTADTHRTAAALMETGIDFFAVNKRHFRTKSRRRIALEAALMGSLEFFHGGRGVFLTVPRSLMESLGATENDAEDLVEAEPAHRGQRPGERHGGLPPPGRRRPRHGRRGYPHREPGAGKGPDSGGRGPGEALVKRRGRRGMAREGRPKGKKIGKNPPFPLTSPAASAILIKRK